MLGRKGRWSRLWRFGEMKHGGLEGCGCSMAGGGCLMTVAGLGLLLMMALVLAV